MDAHEQFASVHTRTVPREPSVAQVRAAELDDARRAARLTVTLVAGAGAQGDWERRLMRDVSEADRALFVAVEDGDVVGYVRLGRVEAGGPAPDGVYLVGLVVAPAHRRRGLAEALVGLAVDEARGQTDVLWSFFDVANGASAALHAHLGFVERARGAIGFPGLPAGSRDVLVSLDLRDGRAVARVPQVRER